MDSSAAFLPKSNTAMAWSVPFSMRRSISGPSNWFISEFYSKNLHLLYVWIFTIAIFPKLKKYQNMYIHINMIRQV